MEIQENQTLKKESEVQENEQPWLPASFFADLVQQPSCERLGICDGCGRCEH